MADTPIPRSAPTDFFERQEQARHNTLVLEVYFTLAVLSIVFMTYLAVVVFIQMEASRHIEPVSPLNPKLILTVGASTLLFIGCGSLFKIVELSGGGRAVAELLGGRPVQANTTNPGERKLLNIVEEMAIASGTPVPQVYVLPAESGINAFAAGHSTRDMVVCTTDGALQMLTRDELQGVIGHEFSHILNGDMRLNIRLMGWVAGILSIAVVGQALMRTRGRRNPLPPLGLMLVIIGMGGVFFAKLIKSAISRQREFLADASAVQFTRNPLGLANALKKVGGSGSLIDDSRAEEVSHMFFANGLKASFNDSFSTHPPLRDRIRALDPAWDGKFIVPKRQYELDAPAPIVVGRSAPPVDALKAVNTAVMLQFAGTPTQQHLAYAAEMQAQIPGALLEAARSPMSAVALIYALVLSKGDGLRAEQLKELQTRAEPGISQETGQLFAELNWFDQRARLPLASLAMTALRQLSPPQFERFEQNLQYLIESDRQVELFEFTLQKIVRRQLEPNFGKSARTLIQYYAIKPLADDCAVLLSALARVGQTEPGDIEKAFQQGMAVLRLPLTLLPLEQCGVDKLDEALNRLNEASPFLKKQILTACGETVASDGKIEQGEAELLRAVAETLDCPIPSFLSV